MLSMLTTSSRIVSQIGASLPFSRFLGSWIGTLWRTCSQLNRHFGQR